MKNLILTLMALSGLYLSGQVNNVLEPQEFAKKLDVPGVVIMDVRTPDEFSTGHINNAIDIDYRNPNFKDVIRKLDPSKTYMIYCRTGKRSASAIDSLKNLGFKNLYDLNGGITAWKKENLPVVGELADKISKEEYSNIVASDKIVLIDFYAPWCGPCLIMEPMFTKLSEKYRNKITIVRINADENKNIAMPFIQSGFPTLIAYKNQKKQWERTGLIEEKDLTQLIEDLLK